MPRSGRGGQRQGTPGTSYGNRTDLQTSAPVAVATAPGQQYGQRAAQAAAQQQLPVAPPPGPASAAPPPTAPNSTPQPQGQSPLAGLLANPPTLHPTSPEPGESPLTAPSNRPNEPITHGMPMGAGAGPEVLTGIGAIANRANPQDTATKLLATLALQPTAGSQLRDLARLAMTTNH